MESQRSIISYLTCLNCNETFSSQLQHYCKQNDCLPIDEASSFITQENNVQLGTPSTLEINHPRNISSELARETNKPQEAATFTKEQNIAQVMPRLSDENYHQYEILDTDFGNTSSELDRETSESQNEASLNIEFANMRVSSSGILPNFRSTFFSTGYPKRSYEIPNPNQRFANIWEPASKPDVLNEPSTSFEQVSDNSGMTDILSDNQIDNKLNECREITDEMQTRVNIDPLSQSSTDDSHIEATCSYSMKKIYVCTICHKKFPFVSRLKPHSVVHSTEKPYKCEVCGKRFRREIELKAHKIKHTNERLFFCDICKKAYKLKHHLRERSAHRKDRPFKCELCEKTFKLKEKLNKHLVLHKGSLECDICKKVFSEQRNLVMHRYTHLEGKRFQCEKCGKFYTCNENLKIHSRMCNGPVQ